MKPSVISAEALFEEHRPSLHWEWIAGHAHPERRFDETAVRAAQSAADLVGYLNYIHPYRVQIVGRREVAYLSQSTADVIERRIARIVTLEPPVLIVADAQTPPDKLVAMCDRAEIPLFVTEEPAGQRGGAGDAGRARQPPLWDLDHRGRECSSPTTKKGPPRCRVTGQRRMDERLIESLLTALDGQGSRKV